ncbi:Transposase IS4 [Popillia japonica]|uniref:Transposase IS4 n=1 Tax=Popillia japonica TaxID=7064 RepID=A0AAW1JUK2_POPJA
MSKQSNINLGELENLDPSELYRFIDEIEENCITEEQAIDSELDGDSDADDTTPVIINTPRASTSRTQPQNDEIDEDQSNSESEFFPECEASRKKQVSCEASRKKQRGIKIWAIVSSNTGYLLDFYVYEGKRESEENGMLGEKTVLELTGPFTDKFHCVYFDIFFSTFALLAKLLDRKILACGAMRSDRKHFPKEELLPDKRLRGGVKAVLIDSTQLSILEQSTVERMTNDGTKKTVGCPKRIADYNTNMGGVDLFDQLRSCYNISWKSRRWWVTEHRGPFAGKRYIKKMCQMQYSQADTTQQHILHEM